MNQKALRKWKREHPGHRSFTVLRHPVARAHAGFCRLLLADGLSALPEIRKALIDQYGVPLPTTPGPDDGWSREAHRAGFLAFLAFLRKNLAGQTAIRVRASWATQAQVIAGLAQVIQPDHILRETRLTHGLTLLGAEIGRPVPPLPDPQPDLPFCLSEIYDDEIEAAVRAAYQRDYMQFGFRSWA